jgi:hypothetical protein
MKITFVWDRKMVSRNTVKSVIAKGNYFEENVMLIDVRLLISGQNKRIPETFLSYL